jgi:general secretion pathway protein E
MRCRRSAPATALERRHFESHGLPAPEVLWHPGGCAACGGSGETGRVPVFEFFHLVGNDDLSEAVGRSSRESLDERALERLWIDSGGSPLVREGLKRVARGEVAHAELLKYEHRACC